MTLNTVFLELIKNNCPFPTGIPNMICTYIPPVSVDIDIDDINDGMMYKIIHVEELKINIKSNPHEAIKKMITLLKLLSPLNLLKIFHIKTSYNLDFDYYEFYGLINTIITKCNVEQLLFPCCNISNNIIIKCVEKIPTLRYIDVQYIEGNDTPADYEYLEQLSDSYNCMIHENSMNTIYTSKTMNNHVDILYDIYKKTIDISQIYFTKPDSHCMVDTFYKLCIGAPAGIILGSHDKKLRDIPVTNVNKFIQFIYKHNYHPDFGIEYLEQNVSESNQQYLDTFIHSIIGRVCLY